MKFVSESLNSFIRNQNPIKSLGLGYEGKIRSFFRQYNITDTWYKIKEDGSIIFNNNLDLRGPDIVELPNNLTIHGWFYLVGFNLSKLSDNLIVHDYLNISNTNITELPNNLIVDSEIFVYEEQKELIYFIEHSKFKNQLIIL
jgi:hypothetical protein